VKNRYAGHGGRYIRIGREYFPADEHGNALPHDPAFPDVEDDGVAAPEEFAPAPADGQPERTE